MVELPRVPSLDPDNPNAAPSSSTPVFTDSDQGHRRTTHPFDPTGQKPAGAGAASAETFSAKPPPPPPPDPDPSPPANPVGPPQAGPVVPEPVEEILEQTSGLTLQISNLDDHLSAIQTAVVELRLELQSSTESLRAAIGGSAAAGARANQLPRKDSIGERLDLVEVRSGHASNRQAWMLGLAIVQTVLLAVVVLLVLANRRPAPTTPLPAVLEQSQAIVEPTAPTQTDLSPVPTLPEDDPKHAGKKARKKRK